MSSRPAWMAALTLAVRLEISSWYLACSRSSSVTLALTMAILSFMRGTWSFMSRMFCCRIISGSSATEMKKPMKDRIILVKRCHITTPLPLLLRAGFRRRRRAAAGGDWIFGHERRNRIGDLLFFLLLLQPPAEKALFLAGDGIVVG